MQILIPVGLVILAIVSSLLVLLVLAQRAKNDGGVGAAMGGGMAEATFGAETTNVLSKATIRGAIIFFVLAFFLYLAYIHDAQRGGPSQALPEVAMPAPAAPAAPAAVPLTPFSTTPAPAPVTEVPPPVAPTPTQ